MSDQDFGFKANFNFEQSRQSASAIDDAINQIQQFTRALKVLNDSLQESDFDGPVKQLATRSRKVAKSVDQLNKANRDSTHYLKELKDEFKVLNKEVSLVDFGGINSTRQFAKARNEIKLFVRSLKKLEVQTQGNSAAERDFKASLKIKERALKKQLELQEKQRLAMASAARMGEFDFLQGLGDKGLDKVSSQFNKAKEIFIGFDDAMSSVAAISGATGKELQDLRNEAKRLGATTRYNSKEAAEAEAFLASAGFTQKQILATTASSLELASAGALGLADAADIASNVLSGLGMEAEEMSSIADILALASAQANTNVQQLGVAMKYAAPNAKLFGASAAETAAFLGTMSNAGIQADMAGTGARNAFLRLSKPAKEGADAIAELGLELTDQNGNLKNIVSIFEDLSGALQLDDKSLASLAAAGDNIDDVAAGMEKMGNAKQIASLKAIFGTTGISAAASVLQQMDVFRHDALAAASASSNTDQMTDYFKKAGIQVGKDDKDVFSAILKKVPDYVQALKLVEKANADLMKSNIATLSDKDQQKLAEYFNVDPSQGDIFTQVAAKAGDSAKAIAEVNTGMSFLGLNFKVQTRTAQKMAGILENNLGGSIRSFESAMEAVYINLFEPLVPVFRFIIDMATKVLSFIANLPKPFHLLIDALLVLGAVTFATSSVVGLLGGQLFKYAEASAVASMASTALAGSLVPMNGFFDLALRKNIDTNPLETILTRNIDLLGDFGDAATENTRVTGKGLASLGVTLKTLTASSVAFSRSLLLSPWAIAIGGFLILNTVLEQASMMGDGVNNRFNLLGKILSTIAAPVGFLWGIFKGFVTTLGEALGLLGGTTESILAAPFNSLVNAISDAMETFRNFTLEGEELGKRLAEGILTPFKIAANAIQSLWKNALSQIAAPLQTFVALTAAIGQLLVHNLAENSPGPTSLIRFLWQQTIGFITSTVLKLPGVFASVGKLLVRNFIPLMRMSPVIGGIALAVVLLAEAFGLIDLGILTTLETAFQNIASTIRSFAVEKITGIARSVQILTGFKPLTPEETSSYQSAIQSLWKNALSQIAAPLLTFVALTAAIGQLLVHNLAENSLGPTSLIRSLWKKTVEFITYLVSKLPGVFAVVGQKIGQFLNYIRPGILALDSWIREIFTKTYGLGAGLFPLIGAAVREGMKLLVRNFIPLMKISPVIGGIAFAVVLLAEAFGLIDLGILTTLETAFQNIASTIRSFAVEKIQGIAQSITILTGFKPLTTEETSSYQSAIQSRDSGDNSPQTQKIIAQAEKGVPQGKKPIPAQEWNDYAAKMSDIDQIRGNTDYFDQFESQYMSFTATMMARYLRFYSNFAFTTIQGIQTVLNYFQTVLYPGIIENYHLISAVFGKWDAAWGEPIESSKAAAKLYKSAFDAIGSAINQVKDAVIYVYQNAFKPLFDGLKNNIDFLSAITLGITMMGQAFAHLVIAGSKLEQFITPFGLGLLRLGPMFTIFAIAAGQFKQLESAMMDGLSNLIDLLYDFSVANKDFLGQGPTDFLNAVIDSLITIEYTLQELIKYSDTFTQNIVRPIAEFVAGNFLNNLVVGIAAFSTINFRSSVFMQLISAVEGLGMIAKSGMMQKAISVVDQLLSIFAGFISVLVDAFVFINGILIGVPVLIVKAIRDTIAPVQQQISTVSTVFQSFGQIAIDNISIFVKEDLPTLSKSLFTQIQGYVSQIPVIGEYLATVMEGVAGFLLKYVPPLYQWVAEQLPKAFNFLKSVTVSFLKDYWQLFLGLGKPLLSSIKNLFSRLIELLTTFGKDFFNVLGEVSIKIGRGMLFLNPVTFWKQYLDTNGFETELKKRLNLLDFSPLIKWLSGQNLVTRKLESMEVGRTIRVLDATLGARIPKVIGGLASMVRALGVASASVEGLLRVSVIWAALYYTVKALDNETIEMIRSMKLFGQTVKEIPPLDFLLVSIKALRWLIVDVTDAIIGAVKAFDSLLKTISPVISFLVWGFSKAAWIIASVGVKVLAIGTLVVPLLTVVSAILTGIVIGLQKAVQGLIWLIDNIGKIGEGLDKAQQLMVAWLDQGHKAWKKGFVDFFQWLSLTVLGLGALFIGILTVALQSTPLLFVEAILAGIALLVVSLPKIGQILTGFMSAIGRGMKAFFFEAIPAILGLIPKFIEGIRFIFSKAGWEYGKELVSDFGKAIAQSVEDLKIAIGFKPIKIDVLAAVYNFLNQINKVLTDISQNGINLTQALYSIIDVTKTFDTFKDFSEPLANGVKWFIDNLPLIIGAVLLIAYIFKVNISNIIGSTIEMVFHLIDGFKGIGKAVQGSADSMLMFKAQTKALEISHGVRNKKDLLGFGNPLAYGKAKESTPEIARRISQTRFQQLQQRKAIIALRKEYQLRQKLQEKQLMEMAKSKDRVTASIGSQFVESGTKRMLGIIPVRGQQLSVEGEKELRKRMNSSLNTDDFIRELLESKKVKAAYGGTPDFSTEQARAFILKDQQELSNMADMLEEKIQKQIVNDQVIENATFRDIKFLGAGATPLSIDASDTAINAVEGRVKNSPWSINASDPSAKNISDYLLSPSTIKMLEQKAKEYQTEASKTISGAEKFLLTKASESALKMAEEIRSILKDSPTSVAFKDLTDDQVKKLMQGSRTFDSGIYDSSPGTKKTILSILSHEIEQLASGKVQNPIPFDTIQDSSISKSSDLDWLFGQGQPLEKLLGDEKIQKLPSYQGLKQSMTELTQLLDSANVPSIQTKEAAIDKFNTQYMKFLEEITYSNELILNSIERVDQASIKSRQASRKVRTGFGVISGALSDLGSWMNQGLKKVGLGVDDLIQGGQNIKNAQIFQKQKTRLNEKMRPRFNGDYEMFVASGQRDKLDVTRQAVKQLEAMSQFNQIQTFKDDKGNVTSSYEDMGKKLLNIFATGKEGELKKDIQGFRQTNKGHENYYKNFLSLVKTRYGFTGDDDSIIAKYRQLATGQGGNSEEAVRNRKLATSSNFAFLAKSSGVITNDKEALEFGQKMSSAFSGVTDEKTIAKILKGEDPRSELIAPYLEQIKAITKQRTNSSEPSDINKLIKRNVNLSPLSTGGKVIDNELRQMSQRMKSQIFENLLFHKDTGKLQMQKEQTDLFNDTGYSFLENVHTDAQKNYNEILSKYGNVINALIKGNSENLNEIEKVLYDQVGTINFSRRNSEIEKRIEVVAQLINSGAIEEAKSYQDLKLSAAKLDPITEQKDLVVLNFLKGMMSYAEYSSLTLEDKSRIQDAIRTLSDVTKQEAMFYIDPSLTSKDMRRTRNKKRKYIESLMEKAGGFFVVDSIMKTSSAYNLNETELNKQYDILNSSFDFGKIDPKFQREFVKAIYQKQGQTLSDDEIKAYITDIKVATNTENILKQDQSLKSKAVKFLIAPLRPITGLMDSLRLTGVPLIKGEMNRALADIEQYLDKGSKSYQDELASSKLIREAGLESLAVIKGTTIGNLKDTIKTRSATLYQALEHFLETGHLKYQADAQLIQDIEKGFEGKNLFNKSIERFNTYSEIYTESIQDASARQAKQKEYLNKMLNFLIGDHINQIPVGFLNNLELEQFKFNEGKGGKFDFASSKIEGGGSNSFQQYIEYFNQFKNKKDQEIFLSHLTSDMGTPLNQGSKAVNDLFNAMTQDKPLENPGEFKKKLTENLNKFREFYFGMSNTPAYQKSVMRLIEQPRTDKEMLTGSDDLNAIIREMIKAGQLGEIEKDDKGKYVVKDLSKLQALRESLGRDPKNKEAIKQLMSNYAQMGEFVSDLSEDQMVALNQLLNLPENAPIKGAKDLDKLLGSIKLGFAQSLKIRIKGFVESVKNFDNRVQQDIARLEAFPLVGKPIAYIPTKVYEGSKWAGKKVVAKAKSVAGKAQAGLGMAKRGFLDSPFIASARKITEDYNAETYFDKGKLLPKSLPKMVQNAGFERFNDFLMELQTGFDNVEAEGITPKQKQAFMNRLISTMLTTESGSLTAKDTTSILEAMKSQAKTDQAKERIDAALKAARKGRNILNPFKLNNLSPAELNGILGDSTEAKDLLAEQLKNTNKGKLARFMKEDAIANIEGVSDAVYAELARILDVGDPKLIKGLVESKQFTVKTTKPFTYFFLKGLPKLTLLGFTQITKLLTSDVTKALFNVGLKGFGVKDAFDLMVNRVKRQFLVFTKSGLRSVNQFGIGLTNTLLGLGIFPQTLGKFQSWLRTKGNNWADTLNSKLMATNEAIEELKEKPLGGAIALIAKIGGKVKGIFDAIYQRISAAKAKADAEGTGIGGLIDGIFGGLFNNIKRLFDAVTGRGKQKKLESLRLSALQSAASPAELKAKVAERRKLSTKEKLMMRKLDAEDRIKVMQKQSQIDPLKLQRDQAIVKGTKVSLIDQDEVQSALAALTPKFNVVDRLKNFRQSQQEKLAQLRETKGVPITRYEPGNLTRLAEVQAQIETLRKKREVANQTNIPLEQSLYEKKDAELEARITALRKQKESRRNLPAAKNRKEQQERYHQNKADLTQIIALKQELAMRAGNVKLAALGKEATVLSQQLEQAKQSHSTQITPSRVFGEEYLAVQENAIPLDQRASQLTAQISGNVAGKVVSMIEKMGGKKAVTETSTPPMTYALEATSYTKAYKQYKALTRQDFSSLEADSQQKALVELVHLENQLASSRAKYAEAVGVTTEQLKKHEELSLSRNADLKQARQGFQVNHTPDYIKQYEQYKNLTQQDISGLDSDAQKKALFELVRLEHQLTDSRAKYADISGISTAQLKEQEEVLLNQNTTLKQIQQKFQTTEAPSYTKKHEQYKNLTQQDISGLSLEARQKAMINLLRLEQQLKQTGLEYSELTGVTTSQLRNNERSLLNQNEILKQARQEMISELSLLTQRQAEATQLETHISKLQSQIAAEKALPGGGNASLIEIWESQAQAATKHWERTVNSIDKNLSALTQEAKKYGYDIQRSISEGSPGTTANIRENWDHTENSVAENIHQIQAVAEQAGEGIEASFKEAAHTSEGSLELIEHQAKHASHVAEASLEQVAHQAMEDQAKIKQMQMQAAQPPKAGLGSHVFGAMGKGFKSALAVGGVISGAGYAVQGIGFSLQSLGVISEESSEKLYKFSQVFNIFSSVGMVLTPLLGAITSSFAFLASLVPIVFNPITLGIGAVVVGLVLLNKLLKHTTGNDFLSPIIDQFLAPFNKTIDVVKKKLSEFYENIEPTIRPILDLLEEGWEMIKPVVKGFIEPLKRSWAGLVSFLKDFWNMGLSQITTQFGEQIYTLIGFIGTLGSVAVSSFGEVVGAIQGLSFDPGKVIKTISNFMGQEIKQMIGFIDSLLTKILEIGGNVFGGIKNLLGGNVIGALLSPLAIVYGFIRGIAEQIFGVKEVQTFFESIGGSLRSIQEGLSALLNPMFYLGNTLDTIKSRFQETSLIGKTLGAMFARIVTMGGQVVIHTLYLAWTRFVLQFPTILMGLVSSAIHVATSLINALNHDPTERIPEAWREIVVNIIRGLIAWKNQVMQLGIELVRNMIGIITKTRNTIIEIFSSRLVAQVTSKFKAVFRALSVVATKAFLSIAESVPKVFSFLGDLIFKLFSGSINPKELFQSITSNSIAGITGIWEQFASNFRGWVQQIPQLFQAAGTQILFILTEMLVSIASGIAEKFNGAIEQVKLTWVDFGIWVGTAFDSAMSFVTLGIVDKFTLAIDQIKLAWTNFTTWFGTIFSPVLDTAQSIGTKLVNFLNHGAADITREAWAKAAGSAQEDMESLIPVAEKVGGAVADHLAIKDDERFKNFSEGIQNVLGDTSKLAGAGALALAGGLGLSKINQKVESHPNQAHANNYKKISNTVEKVALYSNAFNDISELSGVELPDFVDPLIKATTVIGVLGDIATEVLPFMVTGITGLGLSCGALVGIIGGVVLALGGLYFAWTNNFLGIQEMTFFAISQIQLAWTNFITWFGTALDPVTQVAQSIGSKLVGFLNHGAADITAEAWSRTAGSAQKDIESLVPVSKEAGQQIATNLAPEQNNLFSKFFGMFQQNKVEKPEETSFKSLYKQILAKSTQTATNANDSKNLELLKGMQNPKAYDDKNLMSLFEFASVNKLASRDTLVDVAQKRYDLFNKPVPSPATKVEPKTEKSGGAFGWLANLFSPKTEESSSGMPMTLRSGRTSAVSYVGEEKQGGFQGWFSSLFGKVGKKQAKMQPVTFDYYDQLDQAMTVADKIGDDKAFEALAELQIRKQGLITSDDIANLYKFGKAGVLLGNQITKLNRKMARKRLTDAIMGGDWKTVKQELKNSEIADFFRDTASQITQATQRVSDAIKPFTDEVAHNIQRLQLDVSPLELMSQGPKELAVQAGVIGESLLMFVKEGGLALLQGDVEKFKGAWGDLTTNIKYSVGQMIAAFQSFAITSIAVGVFAITSISPILLVLMAIAFSVAVVMKNFLGLRSIIVGFGKTTFAIGGIVLGVFELIGDIAKATGRILKGLFTLDVSEIKAGLSEFKFAFLDFQGVLDKFTPILKSGLAEIGSGFRKMAMDIAKFLGDSRDVVAKIFDSIANAAKDGMNDFTAYVTVGFQNYIQTVRKNFPEFKAEVEVLIQKLGFGVYEAMQEIPLKIVQLFSGLGEKIRSVFKSTGEITPPPIKTSFIDDYFATVQKNLPEFKAEVAKAMDQISALFVEPFTQIPVRLQEFRASAEAVFEQVISKVKELTSLFSGVGKIADTLSNGFKSIFGKTSGAIEAVKTEAERIGATAQSIGSEIAQLGNRIDGLGEVKFAFETVNGLDRIQEAVVVTRGTVETFQNSLREVGKNDEIKRLVDTFKSVAGQSEGIFTQVADHIKQSFREVADTIPDQVKEMLPGFEVVSDKVITLFREVGSQLKPLIGAAFDALPTEAKSKLTEVEQSFTALVSTAKTQFDNLGVILKTIWDAPTENFKGNMAALISESKITTELMTGHFVEFKNSVSAVFDYIGDRSKQDIQKVQAVVETITSRSKQDIQKVKNGFTAVGSHITGMFAKTEKEVGGTLEKMEAHAQETGNSMKSDLSENSPGPTAHIRRKWRELAAVMDGILYEMQLSGARTGEQLEASFEQAADKAYLAMGRIESQLINVNNLTKGVDSPRFHASTLVGNAEGRHSGQASFGSVTRDHQSHSRKRERLNSDDLSMASATLGGALGNFSMAAATPLFFLNDFVDLFQVFGGILGKISLQGLTAAKVFGFMGVGLQFLTAGFMSLMTVLWPFLLAIGAIALAGFLLYRAYTDNFMGLKSLIDGIAAGFVAFWESLKSGFISEAVGIFQVFETEVRSIFQTIGSVFSTLFYPLTGLITGFKQLFGIKDQGDGLKQFFVFLGKAIGVSILIPLKIVLEILKVIIKVVSFLIKAMVVAGGVLSTVMLTPVYILVGLFQVIVSIFQAIKASIEWVVGGLGQLAATTSGALSKIPFIGKFFQPTPVEKTQQYAGGGLVTGPGSGTSDDIPLWASNGEYIVNANATRSNYPLLEAINNGESLSVASPVVVPPPAPIMVAAPAASGLKAGSFGFEREAPPVEVHLHIGEVIVQGVQDGVEAANDFLEQIGPQLRRAVLDILRDSIEFRN